MNKNNILKITTSLYNCPTNKLRAANVLYTRINRLDRELLSVDKNTHPDILTILADDEDYWARCRIAFNPSTPTSILEILAKDENYLVRGYVAKNTSTPIETIEILVNDANAAVRAEAIQNLKERNK